MKFKKSIAVIAALMLCASATACSGTTSSSNASSVNSVASTNSSAATPSNAAESAATDKTGPTSGKAVDYDVAIESVKTAKDYNGKDAAIVKFKWTNGSKKADSAMACLMMTVYQDGVQLEPAVITSDSLAENESKSIQPGKSLEFECAYALSGKEKKIQVDVSDIASLGSNKVSTTLDVK